MKFKILGLLLLLLSSWGYCGVKEGAEIFFKGFLVDTRPERDGLHLRFVSTNGFPLDVVVYQGGSVIQRQGPFVDLIYKPDEWVVVNDIFIYRRNLSYLERRLALQEKLISIVHDNSEEDFIQNLQNFDLLFTSPQSFFKYFITQSSFRKEVRASSKNKVGVLIEGDDMGRQVSEFSKECNDLMNISKWIATTNSDALRMAALRNEIASFLLEPQTPIANLFRSPRPRDGKLPFIRAILNSFDDPRMAFFVLLEKKFLSEDVANYLVDEIVERERWGKKNEFGPVWTWAKARLFGPIYGYYPKMDSKLKIGFFQSIVYPEARLAALKLAKNSGNLNDRFEISKFLNTFRGTIQHSRALSLFE